MRFLLNVCLEEIHSACSGCFVPVTASPSCPLMRWKARKREKADENGRRLLSLSLSLSLNPSRFPYSRPSISAAPLSYELFIVMDTFVRDTRMMYCTFSKLRCNFFVLCFLYFNVRGILSLFLLFMKISL